MVDKKLWLCDDTDFVDEYFGWVAEEDDSLDMAYVTDRYYDEKFLSPEPIWKQVLEKNATRIDLWGGEIEYVDKWKDEENIIRVPSVVASSDDRETGELADFLEDEFEKALDIDQTEFLKSNYLTRQD